MEFKSPGIRKKKKKFYITRNTVPYKPRTSKMEFKTQESLQVTTATQKTNEYSILAARQQEA